MLDRPQQPGSPADALVRRLNYDKNMINALFRLGSIVPCILLGARQTHRAYALTASKPR